MLDFRKGEIYLSNSQNSETSNYFGGGKGGQTGVVLRGTEEQ